MNRRFRLRAIAAIIGSMGTPDTGLTFRAPLQTSLLPTRAAGSATPTFTRATTKRFIDFEGLVRTAISGEACFEGARRVRNLCPITEGDVVATWNIYNSNATLTANTTDVADPLGGNQAVKVVCTGGQQVRMGVHVDQGTGTFRHSVWIRTASGTASVQQIDGWTTGNTYTVTTTWQRFTSTISNATLGRTLYTALSATNATFYVAFPMFEEVTGQSNTNPSEYVSSGVLSAPYHGAGVDGVKYFDTLNGNTVTSNVVTEATGPSISGSGKFAATSGNSGEYFSTPDSAATSITGDIDIRVKVRMEDWSPSGAQTFYAKDSASGNHRGHWFYMDATALQYSWSPDGTGAAIITKNSDTKPSITDGTVAWVRVTHDVDDGSGNNVVKFYYSLDDGVTWTQHGTTKTTAGTTSQADVNASPSIGANNSGDNRLNGRVYRAIVKNGIDGTTVLDFNPNDYTSGGSWVSSTTGEWWYLNGNAKVFGASAASYKNFAGYSQEFDNAAWSKSNVSVVADQYTAPDGTTTMDKLLASAGAGLHYLQQNGPIATAVPYTLSFDLKYVNCQYAIIGLYDGTNAFWAVFDLLNGTVGGKHASATSAITALGSGVYRCSMTATPAAATLYLQLGPANASSPASGIFTSWNPAGTEAIGVWGGQLEAASSASAYIPTTSAAVTVYGVPSKFDGRGPYGHFAEGARTNLLTYSTDLSNGAWTGAGADAAFTANAAVAPDGTTTAAKLIPNAGVVVGYASRGIAVTNGTTYAGAIYAKAGEYPRLGLRFYDGAVQYAWHVTINLLTGAVVANSGVGTAVTVTPCTNGWWRIEVAGPSAATGTGYWIMEAKDASTVCQNTFTADGTSGIYVWGAQLEAASFASSYIPTTTASVTRNADDLQYANSGNFNASAGTAYAEVFVNGALGGAQGIVGLKASQDAALYRNSSNNLGLYDGTNVVDGPSLALGSLKKVASSWEGSASKLVVNGGTITTGSFDGAFAPTTIYVGSAGSGADQLFGTIRNVNIYGRTLADARLQALTA